MESSRKRDLTRYSLCLKRKDQKKSQILTCIEKFLEKKNMDLEIAIDNYIYGIPCNRVLRGAKIEAVILSVDEEDQLTLKILNQKTGKKEKINVRNFQDVDFDKERGEIKNLEDKMGNFLIKNKNSQNYISLLTNKSDGYDFIFKETTQLDFFLTAFHNFLSIHVYGEDDNLNEKFLESIRNIWLKYDKNYSGKLDMEEFEKFAKELNLILNKSFSIKDLFKSIDRDNSETIDFEEFFDYYKKFTNGEEFRFIFDRYSEYNEFFKSRVISPINLINFYNEVQKESINDRDAKIFILLIKKNLSDELLERIKEKLNKEVELTEEENKHIFLTLDEFKILIYDKLISCVYSSETTDVLQDMSKPLNDYYMFSSHNTYLTGHQVYGSCDPEMYSSALLLGCRLVELDVYNGGIQGPIVKHGFTMTGEILLKDALLNIRKSAFVKSDFPVTLSIENHCNEENQIKMGNMFKDILVDLFILEDDTELVKFPSPNRLKGKFIVKAKREKIIAKNKDTEERNLEKKTIITSQSNKDKLLNIEKKKSLGLFIQKEAKEKVDKQENNQRNFLDRQYLTRNIREITNNSNLMFKNQMNNSKINQSIMNVENDENLGYLEESKILLNDKEAEKIEKEAFRNKKNNVPIIFGLSQTIGMIGRKLVMDKIAENKYQYWDCVTKKDDYIIGKSHDYNNRIKLAEFCKRSFSKAYPTNLSSFNYDCVKVWTVGVQIAAMNIQKLDDDFLLLNIVFFKQNRESGFVLKPKKLRDRTIEYNESYSNPLKKLSIKLISGYMLNMLGIDNITNKFIINLKNLRLQIKLIGSVKDDAQKNNNFEILIEENLLNPHFDVKSHILEIYESELSALFIHIYSDNVVIGRSVIPLCMLSQGLRCVPIYDKNAEEFRDSRLIFLFEFLQHNITIDDLSKK